MGTTATGCDESGGETQETQYNAWIRAELTRRMQTPQGKTPHEQVMAEMDALIARIAAKRQAH